MPDRWESQDITLQGGLNTNEDTFELNKVPGVAVKLINYEPSIYGGYRRIDGYEKYDTTALPGSGNVLGVFVFNGGVIGCRGTEIYFSTGSGWGAAIATGLTSAAKYWAVKYNWTGTRNIILCNGATTARRWDGTTMTNLNGAGAPAAPKYVEEFRNHMFFAGHSSNASSLIFSAPNDETDFSAINGAGEIVVGGTITGIKRFRDRLFVFCEDAIYQVTGQSSLDFQVAPITRNLGCLSGWTIQEFGGDLIFLGPDGFRTIAATDRIGDVELGNISRSITNLTDDLVSAAGAAANITSIIFREKSQYRLFYPATADAVADAKGIIGGVRRTTITDQDKLSWEWGELLGIKPYCADSDFISDVETYVFGGFDGFVYKFSDANDFAGSNVKSSFWTPHLFYGDFAHRKIFHKLHLFYRVEGQASLMTNLVLDFDDPKTIQPSQITVTEGAATAIYGNTESKYGTAVYGGEQFPEARTNLIGAGNSAQLRFESDDTNPPWTLQGFLIQYATAGRR